jgi:hypothetical protein
MTINIYFAEIWNDLIKNYVLEPQPFLVDSRTEPILKRKVVGYYISLYWMVKLAIRKRWSSDQTKSIQVAAHVKGI